MRYQATAPPKKPRIKKKSGATETAQAKAKIQDVLKRTFNPCYLEKIHSGPFKRGQPDFFGILEGVGAVIESKKQGEEVTLLQEIHLNGASRAGGVALVIWLNHDGTMAITDYGLSPAKPMVNRVAEALGIRKILSPGA